MYIYIWVSPIFGQIQMTGQDGKNCVHHCHSPMQHFPGNCVNSRFSEENQMIRVVANLFHLLFQNRHSQRLIEKNREIETTNQTISASVPFRTVLPPIIPRNPGE